jgi:hypothetical protein
VTSPAQIASPVPRTTLTPGLMETQEQGPTLQIA